MEKVSTIVRQKRENGKDTFHKLMQHDRIVFLWTTGEEKQRELVEKNWRENQNSDHAYMLVKQREKGKIERTCSWHYSSLRSSSHVKIQLHHTSTVYLDQQSLRNVEFLFVWFQEYQMEPIIVDLTLRKHNMYSLNCINIEF